MNGQGRIGGSAGDETAGVDDEQVGYVMGLAKTVENRCSGVIAHAAGSHIVGRIAEFVWQLMLAGTGRIKNILSCFLLAAQQL